MLSKSKKRWARKVVELARRSLQVEPDEQDLVRDLVHASYLYQQFHSTRRLSDAELIVLSALTMPGPARLREAANRVSSDEGFAATLQPFLNFRVRGHLIDDGRPPPQPSKLDAAASEVAARIGNALLLALLLGVVGLVVLGILGLLLFGVRQIF